VTYEGKVKGKPNKRLPVAQLLALGNLSVVELALCRPVTLRPRLSVGFALFEAVWHSLLACSTRR
jgi:hypothetical protein